MGRQPVSAPPRGAARGRDLPCHASPLHCGHGAERSSPHRKQLDELSWRRTGRPTTQEFVSGMPGGSESSGGCGTLELGDRWEQHLARTHPLLPMLPR